MIHYFRNDFQRGLKIHYIILKGYIRFIRGMWAGGMTNVRIPVLGEGFGQADNRILSIRSLICYITHLYRSLICYITHLYRELCHLLK